MDGYGWIALLSAVVTAYAVWKIRKRQDYKYSLLDTSGIILNMVLLVMVYPPLSVVGALLELFQFATEPITILLESAAIAMGRLMPTVCVASIGTSVILRRKEKPVPSFLVQFIGGIWFCVMILLGKLSGSY